MTQPDYESLRKAAEAARREAKRGRELRAELRWKVQPSDPIRRERLDKQLEQMRKAMVPVRSGIGSLRWEPMPRELELEVRAASLDLQAERKQLKKMQRES
jgi:hypothetical protein